MYEEYEREQVPRARTAMVSLGRSTGHGRGKWNFNALVGRKIEAEGIEALKLLYDPITRQFALKKAPVEDKNAFIVIKPKRDPLTSMGLSTPTFFDKIGFLSKRRVHVEVKWNSELQAFEGFLPKENIGQRRAPLKTGPKPLSTRAVQ